MQAETEFVVSVLDLFKGQLSLNDVLNTEIAYINFLCQSRQKYLQEVEKAKAAALEKATKGNNSGGMPTIDDRRF